jgi:hypothetical protein
MENGGVRLAPVAVDPARPETADDGPGSTVFLMMLDFTGLFLQESLGLVHSRSLTGTFRGA